MYEANLVTYSKQLPVDKDISIILYYLSRDCPVGADHYWYGTREDILEHLDQPRIIVQLSRYGADKVQKWVKDVFGDNECITLYIQEGSGFPLRG